MRWISLVLVLSPALVFGANYEETRQVVDSVGKKFKCTYKLNYNSQAKFNKAKSSASCTPNKKGKKTVSSITSKDYVAPTTTTAPALTMTHDCTCKMSPDSQGQLLTSVRSAVPVAVSRQLFGGGLFSNLGNNIPSAPAPAPALAPAGLDLASLLGGG